VPRPTRYDGLQLRATGNIVAERHDASRAIRQQLNEFDGVSKIEVIYLIRFDSVNGRKRFERQ
jgi:hypothetical protein